MLHDHCTVTFEHVSGQPRDRVVNTFTFYSTAGDLVTADLAAIDTALESFYNTAHAPSTSKVGAFLSNALSRTTKPIIRHYNIDDHMTGGPAGSPVRISNFAANLPTSLSTTPLPAEVAICLSMHGPYGTDVEFAPGARPRARDRGRIFLGPLCVSAITTGTGGRCVPDSLIQNALLDSGVFLRDTLSASKWSIWSRVNGTVHTVTDLWVDDAMDTHRGRGERPISRLTRP